MKAQADGIKWTTTLRLFERELSLFRRYATNIENCENVSDSRYIYYIIGRVDIVLPAI